ncbi:hypothetical protein [Streptomyces sp. NPDC049915]|uniref:hypothetical protein n=1 Tax=Streptomyces sp. NPDC049915 TaxID=3155510 RepID=UPI003442432B
MTWQPALSGAAVRVVRAVAGRRVLQAALLLGGLLVLGLLCGQRAQAAEQAPAAPLTKATATVASASPETPSLAPSATRPASRAVDARVVRPIGEVRDATTAAVHDAAGIDDTVGIDDTAGFDETAPVKTLPVPSAPQPLPALPARPAPPALPQAPSLPALHGAPHLPVPSAPGVDGGGVPAGHSAAPAPAGPVRAADASAFRAHRSGPVAASAQPQPRHTAHPLSTRPLSAHPGRDTVPQGPADGPSGAVVGGSAAGDGTPGHGDAYAVTPRHRLPLPVRAGTAAPGAAPRIQDRYRDIPVFPA